MTELAPIGHLGGIRVVINWLVRWGFIFLAATSTVLTESLVLVRATPVLWLPLGAICVMLGWWGLREDGW